MKKINAYGLTGNMGCGKSTVAKYLQKYDDICVIDCDEISKKILVETNNSQKIKNILGNKVIKNGVIDKKEVSKIIFDNPDKKKLLENFLHPLVWQKVEEKIQEGNKNTIFIVESALIYELKKEKDFRGIIVVTCDKKEQFERIKKRSNWSDWEIKKRLKNQLSNEYKAKRALVVIDTSCSIKELKIKVEKLHLCLVSALDDES
jgi:dephospho-CoA kinase